MDEVFSRLGASDADAVIGSANGTFIDRAEHAAISRHGPAAQIYAPKISLGESVGASRLWQVMCAAQALNTGDLPSSSAATDRTPIRRVIVPACGMNQQVAGLSITLANPGPDAAE